MVFKHYTPTRKKQTATTNGVKAAVRFNKSRTLYSLMFSLGKDSLKLFGATLPENIRIEVDDENNRRILFSKGSKDDPKLGQFSKSKTNKKVFFSWDGYLPKPENQKGVECKYEAYKNNSLLITLPE